jgi:Cys-rich protein (TIGR01571 family)
MFLAGQISNRIGWFDTVTVVAVFTLMYSFFWFIGFIIAAAVPPPGDAVCVLLFWCPYFFSGLFLMLLRVKFVEKFRIAEEQVETLVVGCCCAPCSLCQMARHLYGYSRQFDGDGLIDGSMNYQLLPQRVQSNESSPSLRFYVPPGGDGSGQSASSLQNVSTVTAVAGLHPSCGQSASPYNNGPSNKLSNDYPPTAAV